MGLRGTLGVPTMKDVFELFHEGNQPVESLFLLLCTQIGADILKFQRVQVWKRVKPDDAMRHRDMLILLYLTMNGNRLTPSDIATGLKYDRSTLTRSTKTLEALEYVALEENTRDQRSIELVATDMGLDLCLAYWSSYHKTMTAMTQKYMSELAIDNAAELVLSLRQLARIAERLASETKLLPIESNVVSDVFLTSSEQAAS